MTNRKTCKIADYIANIIYYYERYGSDGLCVGTDFCGTDFLPKGLEGYSDFLSLKEELVKRGVSLLDADKILYKNLSDFIDNS